MQGKERDKEYSHTYISGNNCVFALLLHSQEERNGFTFDGTDNASLHGALDRAINLYKGSFEKWNEYSLRNMKVCGSCLGVLQIQVLPAC
jgi:glycogen synthase